MKLVKSYNLQGDGLCFDDDVSTKEVIQPLIPCKENDYVCLTVKSWKRKCPRKYYPRNSLERTEQSYKNK